MSPEARLIRKMLNAILRPGEHHHCHLHLLSKRHQGHLLRRSFLALQATARDLLIPRGLELRCRSAIRIQQMSRLKNLHRRLFEFMDVIQKMIVAKLQELTATVEKLANVIEHMSKSQSQKTEPVELKPKQRSRTPRGGHSRSRSNSRTLRRGRRHRSRSRRNSRTRRRSPSPKRSPAKIIPRQSSGHLTLPSRPSAP